MSIVDRPVELPAADPLELIPTLPDEPVTKRDVLLRAADIIERDGWTRSWLVNRCGQHCIRGAVLAALGVDVDSYHYGGVHPQEGFLFGTDPYGPDRPAGWNNDLPDGSDDRVASALRRLADGATWEEATA